MARSTSPSRRLGPHSRSPLTPRWPRLSTRRPQAGTSRSYSTSAGRHSMPGRSASGSSSNAGASSYEASRPTGFARLPAGALLRPDALPMRSPPSAGTKASTRSPATPGKPIRPAWRETPWQGQTSNIDWQTRWRQVANRVRKADEMRILDAEAKIGSILPRDMDWNKSTLNLLRTAGQGYRPPATVPVAGIVIPVASPPRRT